jgi:hypothetical protein
MHAFGGWGVLNDVEFVIPASLHTMGLDANAARVINLCPVCMSIPDEEFDVLELVAQVLLDDRAVRAEFRI